MTESRVDLQKKSSKNKPLINSRRLFPCDNEFIGVQTSLSKNSNGKYTYQYYGQLRTPGSSSYQSCGHYSKTHNTILPNGFYFYLDTYSFSDRPLEIKHDLQLKKIFSDESIKIEEPIDPALVALVKNSNEDILICGVSDNKKSVYLYNTTVRGYSIVKYGKGESDFVQFPEYKISSPPVIRKNSSQTGELVYSTQQEIVSITGMPNCSFSKIAMMLNNNKLLVADIHLFGFKECKISQPIFASSNITLLSSMDGVLIAHEAEKNKLYFWDFKLSTNYQTIACTNLYNLNISISGKYLTALEFEGGIVSTKVHLYDLSSLTYRCLSIDPIVDFAIGKNDQTVIYINDDNLLRNGGFAGKIDDILKKSDKLQKDNSKISNKILGLFARYAPEKLPFNIQVKSVKKLLFK